MSSSPPPPPSTFINCVIYIWHVEQTYMWGPSWPWSYGSCIYNFLCNQCLSLLMLWVRISIRARCTTLCDKVCQWLVTGQWFSPGPLVSSTNKTDRHDINEILLKVALNTINQSIHTCVLIFCSNQISDMATIISPMKTTFISSQQKWFMCIPL